MTRSGSSPDGTTPKAGTRLSRKDRRELLADIERHASRVESPARTLQRAEQALSSGSLERAGRYLEELGRTAPDLTGLDSIKARLEEMEKRDKLEANIRSAEEMLTRYLQQRKKKLAELALETLLELAPDHPRRREYAIWVRDVDQEVEVQKRIDDQLAAGLAALQLGALDEARRRLDALREIDPDGAATVALEAEMNRAERGQAESADIEQSKRKVEELLAGGEMEAAEQEVARLAHRDVPKITLDFLHKRLEDARERLRVEEQMEALNAEFERHLEAGDWQDARDLAQRFGKQFQTSSRAVEMFNEVSRRESAERRLQSIAEGIATLEQFITEGKRSEAELALKLLQSLHVEPEDLATFEQRVARL